MPAIDMVRALVDYCISTIPQRLHASSAPTFDQDFLVWLTQKAT